MRTPLPTICPHACRAALEVPDARIAEPTAIPNQQRTFANTVLALEEARAVMKEARAAWGLFGYDAAYYSYLWSKVLADDMYTR